MANHDAEGLDRTRALQAAEQVLDWASHQTQSTNAE